MNQKLRSLLNTNRKWLIPFGAGLLGSFVMLLVYFGIVSVVESPNHAINFFIQDIWIVIPIILGFGFQVALYMVLKLRLFIPDPLGSNSNLLHPNRAAKGSLGASGTTSTIAMVACCAHHVTDVLPILGLTAATAFLAQYRLWFMAIGLGMTILGIVYMLFVIYREKKMALRLISPVMMTQETL